MSPSDPQRLRSTTFVTYNSLAHKLDQVSGPIADIHLACETMEPVSGPFAVNIVMRCRADRPISVNDAPEN